MLTEYIDLTDQACDLSHYRIEATPDFNCVIIDDAEKPNEYSGFLLAKSKGGEAYTVCDVDFHYSQKDRKYATRLIFRRTFKDGRDKEVGKNQIFQRISFQTGTDGYREFWKMISFLETFKETVDVGEFLDEFKVVSKEEIVSNLKKIDESERTNYLMKIIEESKSNEDVLANLLALKQRQQSIKVFKLLMDNEDNYRKRYRKHHKITKPGDEAVWHHFFKAHKWIFGLSLDLRFTEDYLDEQSLGNQNTSGNGSPVVDFMGISSFTTLIEIKTPEKKFFKDGRSNGSRTNTWSFHDDFIAAISQCLGQKDAFLKNIASKDLVDENKVTQDKRLIRTVDPKTILVYGDKSKELPDRDNSTDNFIKKDSLERFIRDSRNLIIISFDELYSRASEIAKLPLE